MDVIKSFFEGIINICLNNPKLLLETIILIVLCIILIAYYPKFRGFMGEFWVKLDDKCFISVICFSNQAKIDVKSKSIVIQVDYLKNEILKCEELLVEDDIKKLKNIIISNNIEDKSLRK